MSLIGRILGYDQLPYGGWFFVCRSHNFKSHSIFKTWLHERFFCKPKLTGLRA